MAKNPLAMMIMADKKAKGPAAPAPEMGEGPEDEAAEGDDSQAEQSAAEDIMKAIQQNDPAGLADALKNFMDICQ